MLEQGYQSDIVFIVHGKSFCAHRCILSARSAYFAEMFETKWKGKNMIALKHPLVSVAVILAFSFFSYFSCMRKVSGKDDVRVNFHSVAPGAQHDPR